MYDARNAQDSTDLGSYGENDEAGKQDLARPTCLGSYIVVPQNLSRFNGPNELHLSHYKPLLVE